MILDLEGSASSKRGRGAQGALVIISVGLALIAAPLLFRPVPTTGARSPLPTARAVPIATAASGPLAPAASIGPSVFAQLARAVPLPPPLQLPSNVATLISTSNDGSASGWWPSHGVRLLYRLPDGRQISLLQRPPDSGVLMLASYAAEEASVRGHDARLLASSPRRPSRSTVTLAWVEGGAGYEMTTRGLTIREVINLAELLR